MGYKHTEDDILDGAMGLALDEGLGSLTFGRLAKRLDINDRTIVYYFPTKPELIGAVLGALGLRLQVALEDVLDDIDGGHVEDHVGLLRVAWPVVTDGRHERLFALYFEAAGYAAVGREPYVDIVPGLTEAWIAWAATQIDGPSRRRQAEAEAAVAILDGLLLLRHLSEPSASDRAARLLGIA